MRGIKLAVTILILIITSALTVTAGIYTNGFESLSALYLVAGDSIYSEDAEITVNDGEEVEFEVKGAGFKSFEYDVQVLSNSKTAFTAGGSSYIWYVQYVTDKLITLTDTGFIFTSKTIGEVITLTYGDDVQLDEGEDGGACDYIIVVTRGDHCVSITVSGESYVAVDEIELDHDHLIF